MKSAVDKNTSVFLDGHLDRSNWKRVRLGDLLSYEQPYSYIVNNREYSKAGTPVLTPGKTFILGYTQENNGLCHATPQAPRILFDDFLTISRLVEFDFKVKSSAVKILSPASEDCNLRFLFYAMSQLRFDVVDHQRHWIGQFSKLEIAIPKRYEQDRIAAAIMACDKHIAALQSLISKYQAIKKATVNLLLKPRDEWNKIRLGDFEAHRNNTCSRSLTSSSAGKVRNIHYGDILVKYSEIVSLEFDKVDYLSEAGEAHSPNDYLQDGDIVIADTAEDETAGKVVEVQDVADRKAVAGLHTVFLRPPNDLFARGWLGYWMNSRFYHNQLLPYMTGIKVLSLSKSNLANTEIYHPPRTEQERLVETLESIDAHIVALHAQADKARQLKKGMMSDFFG